MSLLFTLCDVLDTSPNYLFEYADENDDRELLERIYKLTPEQKKAMLCVLDAYIKFKDEDS